MDTLEMESLRRELLRDILDVDDLDVLKKMKRSFNRLCANHATPAQETEDLRPYTMEELNARIDEAEAEEDTGTPAIPHEEVMIRMHKLIAMR